MFLFFWGDFIFCPFTVSRYWALGQRLLTLDATGGQAVRTRRSQLQGVPDSELSFDYADLRGVRAKPEYADAHY